MFASSIKAPQAPSAATPLLHLYSDAALEDAAVLGLGGYMHGFYWMLPLHGDQLLLPISVLELVAIGINLITFGDLAAGARVALCSDSLSSQFGSSAHESKREKPTYGARSFTHLRIPAGQNAWWPHVGSALLWICKSFGRCCFKGKHGVLSRLVRSTWRCAL